VKLRLVTRGSALALRQADTVRHALEAFHGGIRIDVVTVRTTGDRETDAPLSSLGGTGLFTSELDRVVAAGEADIAVHSLKDVPTVTAEGLRIIAVLEREDARDAFVPGPGGAATLEALPRGARVGTSSLRRRALLGEIRPDLEVVELRGNLDTRLHKLRAGACDAAVLALAGLRRLGREDVTGEILEAPPWLPAAGQGAIAVVARDGDDATRTLVAPLDHASTRFAITAERAFLRTLRGGCQVPVGAFATVDAARLSLHGLVASLDGKRVLRGALEGDTAAADATGVRLASELLDAGADEVLAGIRTAAPSVSAP